MIRFRSLAPALAAACLVLAAPAGAAVIHPNITTDVVDPNDHQCSLREAVSAANDNAASGLTFGECPPGDPAPAMDTISLDAATYTLSLDTPARTTCPGRSSSISSATRSRSRSTPRFRTRRRP